MDIFIRSPNKQKSAVPNRKGEIANILLAGSGQEAAMDASGLQNGLCVYSRQISVEPPG